MQDATATIEFRLDIKAKSDNADKSYINQSYVASGDLNKYSSYRLVGGRLYLNLFKARKKTTY